MPKFYARGFTLIELLVVISIIALLASIGLTFYGSFLKSSRDARRQADLKVIQSALEEYRADQFYYPCANGTSGLPFGEALTSSIGNCLAAPSTSVKTYLNILPTDPVTSNDQYTYTASPPNCNNSSNPITKCTSYCVFARMENTQNTVSGCTLSGYNFAVTLP